jgi:hypothetical protein
MLFLPFCSATAISAKLNYLLIAEVQLHAAPVASGRNQTATTTELQRRILSKQETV